MVVRAYVDGSYNARTGVYGAGAVLLVGDANTTVELSCKGEDPTWARQRNVAGEVLAVTTVIEACKQLPGLDQLIIFYDYAGIESWATGVWKARTTLSQSYVRLVQSLPFSITWRKVRAHSGVPNNERADALAKLACGLS